MNLNIKSSYAQLCETLKTVGGVNLFYTAVLYFTAYGFSITLNMFGATMVDISKIYNVSLTVVTQMVTANSVGYMIGTLAGWSYQWVNRQIVQTTFIAVLAITNVLVPYYTPVWVAFVGITLNGIAQGVFSSVIQIWLIEMWPNVGTATVLIGGHFCFGLGTSSAPLLATKYVYGEANVTADGEVLTAEMRKQNLLIPYGVNAAIQLIPSIILLILFFTHRYRKPEPTIITAKFESTSKEPSPKVPYRTFKLALSGLCIATYFTAESGYFPYCTSMLQFLDIKLSASEANRVTSVLSLMYTIGPLITAFISLKLKAQHIIAAHYVIVLTGISILYFGQLNKTLIYTGSAILGYGFAAMIPSIYAFIQENLTLNNRVASVFSFTNGTLSLVIPLVLGPYLETKPLLLIYLVVAFVGTSAVLFITNVIWIAIDTKKGEKSVSL